MSNAKSLSPAPIDPDSNPSSDTISADVDRLPETEAAPSIPIEFCRLIARILRRRRDDNISAEDQSQEAIPRVAPTEYPNDDDKSEEANG